MSLLSSRIARNFTRRNIGIFPHWARRWPLPQCGFQSLQLSPPKVLDLHMKQLVIRNRAVLPGSCRLQFQLFSERLRVLYEFGMKSFTYTFGLLLLALPKPLSGPLEASKSLATSTIFYWALFMLLYSFLSTILTWYFALPMRFSPLTACSTWVYLLCNDWSCWCDCTGKNCLRSQELVPHLPRKYKFGERRVAANLKTCLMLGAQKVQTHPAHCGQFTVSLLSVATWPSVA